jgi:hypothetical protein
MAQDIEMTEVPPITEPVARSAAAERMRAYRYRPNSVDGLSRT